VIHQSHLRAHISNLNSAYSSYYGTLAARLARQTGDPVAAQGKALALVDSLVHRQAAILAYNDLAWLFGIMFLATLPLLFFLPRRPRARAASKSGQP
jgi:DHA2 family multidrug resistance protein